MVSTLYTYILLVSAILSSFCVRAQQTDSICTLTGDIKGLGESRLVFNFAEDTDREMHNDTIRASNGHFVYRVHLTHPAAVNIQVLSNDPPSKDPQIGSHLTYTRHGHHFVVFKDVLLENRNMYLKTNIDSFRIAHIENAPLNDTILYLRGISTHLYRTDPAWRSWLNANHHGHHLTASQMIQKDSMLNIIYSRAEDSIVVYIRKHPSSYISANILWLVMRADQATQETLYNSLDPSLKKIPRVVMAKAHMDKNKNQIHLSIGEKAPEISLADTAGQATTLSAHRGKATLVEFWASWCGPCRHENPNVLKVYKKYHKKGLEIYAVSLDDNRESWIAAIQKDQLPWTQVSALKGWGGDAVLAYGIKGIPSNFLLDKDGKIIIMELRGKELGNAIHEALK